MLLLTICTACIGFPLKVTKPVDKRYKQGYMDISVFWSAMLVQIWHGGRVSTSSSVQFTLHFVDCPSSNKTGLCLLDDDAEMLRNEVLFLRCKVRLHSGLVVMQLPSTSDNWS